MQKESLAESTTTKQVGHARVAIGLLQGVVLYFLYFIFQTKTGLAANAYLFFPLLFLSLFVPFIANLGLGDLNWRQRVGWLVSVALISILCAVYSIWRARDTILMGHTTKTFILPFFPIFATLSMVFFIAHTLICSAAVTRRWLAAYSDYFNTAWKFTIQLIFSAVFVGALWLLLYLGAALFMLIKLNFLNVLLEKAWFAIPISTLAFAIALHITDVQPAVVQGIRSLLLTLMSWLLLVTSLIVVAFLVSLFWTGLTPLWQTKQATFLLLIAVMMITLLVNATLQDHQIPSIIPTALVLSAKMAILSITPIMVIATYALVLRVQQYGWTNERVMAAACLLIAVCYGVGYAWAVLGREKWLSRIKSTNIFNSFVIIVILLGLSSPILDPARIAVKHQLYRLMSGQVSVDRFDFNFLRFNSERYGIEALQGLTALMGNHPETVSIRSHAERALKLKGIEQGSLSSHVTPRDLMENIVWTRKNVNVSSFMLQNWNDRQTDLPACLKEKAKRCYGYLINLNDKEQAVLLVPDEPYARSTVFVQSKQHVWAAVGTLPQLTKGCTSILQKLVVGDYRLIPPIVNDVEVAGQRLQISPVPLGVHDLCN